MSKEYLISPFGQFIKVLEGTSTEILDQTPAGHSTVLLPPPRSTDYWNGSNWVSIGPAPSPFKSFNYETKQWFDTRSLEAVKDSKWEDIKYQRNKVEFGGFTYNGMEFDSDMLSQGRILAASIMNQPTTWTLANNLVVDLTAQDMQGVVQAMMTHVMSCHARSRLARDNILSSTTIEEIETVLF